MAATTRVGLLKKSFARIKDPRVVGRTKHRLIDIIVMAICGVIGNCDDWVDLEIFAQQRESWFKRFLQLPSGIPAHDTFERVFAQLDPQVFTRCCLEWLRAAADLLGISHIAIDGKTLCGSASSQLGPLHLVSAWANQVKLTLGEVAVDGKSNEITAIPKLLALLDLKGAIVTIDAMGCQTAIAEKIVAGGGDYILAVKGNQQHLLEDIQTTMDNALDGNLPKSKVDSYTTTEQGHGRKEQRIYTVVYEVEGIRDRGAWAGLSTVCMCCRERTLKGKTSLEAHYFIGSRRMSAEKYAAALRDHWGIENGLHWQLDVSFREDASRIQNRNGAENFAWMRKMALCLLTQQPSKRSMAKKRKIAALNPDFLEETLARVGKIEEV